MSADPLAACLTALEDQRELVRLLLTCTAEAIVAMDAAGRCTFVNRACLELLGYEREEELVGRDVHALLHHAHGADAAQCAAGRELFEAFIGGCDAHLPEARLWRRDGSSLVADCRSAPILRNGVLTGCVVTFVDVTERKAAEEKLKTHQHEQQVLFDSVPAFIWYKDKENRILRVNQPAAATVGKRVDELEGSSVYDLYPDEAAQYHRDDLEVIRSGRPKLGIIEQLQTAPGEKRWIQTDKLPYRDEAGEVIGVIVFAQDITERKLLEAQLLQSQKMEGIGRLAGGIAHDFNNLLTAILGHAGLAAKGMAPADPRRLDIEEVEHAARRAASLTRQLLAFARRQLVAPRAVDLGEFVMRADSLLRPILGEDIEIETRSARDLWPVKIDPGQIEQVIVNLAVNARDAMPDGGRLAIETGNVILDQAYAERHHDVAPGPYVLLEVSDTGTGMTEAVLAHIFEPFFTTKEPGKGTGLGLATCYGIVKQAGGHIGVHSLPGEGTTFRIHLPRTLEPVESRAEPAPETPVPFGDETVLLVEDEALVRNLAAQSLRAQGYTVLTASNSAQAFEHSREHSGVIHLLFTDVVLPGMSGPEIAERLRRERPGMRVLLTSGYTDRAEVRRGVLGQGLALLPKPFTPSGLARAVREVLDSPPAG